MTLRRLLAQNLLYHWRGNTAVLLGVAVGTAVLTGALLVGDSLRGSLRDLTLEQLGWVDHALVGGRFVRAALADELEVGHVAPAILLRGAASTAHDGSQAVRRADRVTILGVDERFWNGGQSAPSPQPLSPPELGSSSLPSPLGGERSGVRGLGDGEVALNAALAGELGVRPGDTVVLHMQQASAVPRETPFGRRNPGDVVGTMRLTVKRVLPDEGLARFSLNPTPATPRNAFVALGWLQKQLHQEGRANALLAAGPIGALEESLRRHLTLDDWGLVLHTPESRTNDLFAKLDRNHDGRLSRNEWQRRIAHSMAQAADRNKDGILDRSEVLDFYRRERNYLSLESRQMLVEPVAVEAALATAKEAGLQAAPTLVYLANTISDGQHDIAYSVVAALDPTHPPPLGPFLPPGVDRLADGEIVLADWKASPLTARPGEPITLRYFEPVEQERLRERSASFRLRGRVPLEGVAADPDLTPEFPGITDKLDLRTWDPPFPYDPQRVQRRDEDYWEEYRTTPKAYVTLEEGQRLWGSRFGNVTSIRLAPPAGSESVVADDFGRRLLSRLQPQQGGLVFDDVRKRGLEGSAGSSDFGWLFLAFSVFLIAAALLLVGLLFRLNLEQRARELGILFAAGYRTRTVRRLLLGEGVSLAALGGIVGLVGALGYARLILRLLRAWWPGALDQSFLRLHATPASLAIGYVAALVVSVLTIAWAVRILSRMAPRALLSGETIEESTAAGRPRRRWSLLIAGCAAFGAVALLAAGAGARDAEMRSSSFFGGGALLLTAALAGVWAWLRGSRHGRVAGHGASAVARLGMRNAARHPVRSLLTAGLLASATFLIVGVESFHREPDRDLLATDSGSGGFTLIAESDVPVYQDLNNEASWDALGLTGDARKALDGVRVYPCRLRPGDDASCLNLYKPRLPRLLGVPQALIERGGFRFAATEARSDAEQANPWLLLDQVREDGAVPVFADATTAEWTLGTGLGKELEIPDEHGRPVRLRVVGLLQDSIFQSELLLSQANFKERFPRREGYQFFLIATPPASVDAVKGTLDTALADHGFTATSAARRLEAYLAVENTYLATFQALGGLGLVLGALGLAVVLLRGVWERRGELALLRALGFRERALGWLVLAENGFLLVLGLAAGALTALVAVAPAVAGMSGQVPWLRLTGLLLVVLLVGALSGAAAAASTLRAPLLIALRRE
jgi:ABC-type lipoprotein release transport system permease subunit